MGTRGLRLATRAMVRGSKGVHPGTGLLAWAAGGSTEGIRTAFRSGSMQGLERNFWRGASRVGAAYVGARIAAPMIANHPYMAAGALGLGLGLRHNAFGMRDTRMGGNIWGALSGRGRRVGANTIAQQTVGGGLGRMYTNPMRAGGNFGAPYAQARARAMGATRVASPIGRFIGPMGGNPTLGGPFAQARRSAGGW